MYAFEGLPSTLCQIENTLVGGRDAMKRLLVAALGSVFVIFGLISYLGALAFQRPEDPLDESVYDAYGGTLPTLINVVVRATPLKGASTVVTSQLLESRLGHRST